MKIEHKYLMKHLEMAALEQLIDKYKSDGYTHIIQNDTSSFKIDAVFKKGRSVTIVELFSGIRNKDRLAKRLNRIKSYSKEKYSEYDVKLEMIPIIPNREIVVNVVGLERALLDVIEKNYIDVLNKMHTSFRLEAVSDIEISKVIIDKIGTNLIGNATIDADLFYGSDLDFFNGQIHLWKDSFPFEFDVIYNGLEITKTNNIKIVVLNDYDGTQEPEY